MTAENCLIATGNNPALLRRALRSIRAHAEHQICPVVLHAPPVFPYRKIIGKICRRFGADYYRVPKEVMSKEKPVRRHGEALDWALAMGRPPGEHVWFMDSDATILSDWTVEVTKKLAIPLCGIYHGRCVKRRDPAYPLGQYVYARPAWMAANIDWLFSHAPPWTRICGNSRQYRRIGNNVPRDLEGPGPGKRRGGLDTCERLTVWCRLEGLHLSMLESTNGCHRGQRHAKYGAAGVELVYHRGRSTPRNRWE